MHSRQVSTRGHIEAGMSLELFIGSPRQEMSSHFTPEIYDMHSEPCRGQQEWPFGNGMPRPCGDPRVQDLERFFFFFQYHPPLVVTPKHARPGFFGFCRSLQRVCSEIKS